MIVITTIICEINKATIKEMIAFQNVTSEKKNSSYKRFSQLFQNWSKTTYLHKTQTDLFEILLTILSPNTNDEKSSVHA